MQKLTRAQSVNCFYVCYPNFYFNLQRLVSYESISTCECDFLHMCMYSVPPLFVHVCVCYSISQHCLVVWSAVYSLIIFPRSSKGDSQVQVILRSVKFIQYSYTPLEGIFINTNYEAYKWFKSSLNISLTPFLALWWECTMTHESGALTSCHSVVYDKPNWCAFES